MPAAGAMGCSLAKDRKARARAVFGHPMLSVACPVLLKHPNSVLAGAVRHHGSKVAICGLATAAGDAQLAVAAAAAAWCRQTFKPAAGAGTFLTLSGAGCMPR